MDNHDIDRFFEDSELAGTVERQDRPPNIIWTFMAAGIPMFIQTQENANRMRIVAFIAEAEQLDIDDMTTILQANYHSALDARYALTDEYVVAVFLHPLRELTLTQFLLGLYQTISCAETFGTEFSGGTMVFGGSAQTVDSEQSGPAESAIDNIMDMVVEKIRQSDEETT